jgi:AcrR family transcriptional regulator
MPNTEPEVLIWMRPEPSGRKPRHTRDHITKAAISIADAEGFAAVTMKRIATELDAGTMTLYYYVRTKADVVALMQDEILAELLIADPDLPSGWRDALTAIARRTRAVLLAHPWALGSLNDAQFGPNATRHYEQSLAAISSLTIPRLAKIELLGIVDNFVFGNVLHSVESLERAKAAANDPRLVADAIAYGATLLATGEFPQLASLAGEMAKQPGDADAGPPMSDDALDRVFELGLDALLTGLTERMGLA